MLQLDFVLYRFVCDIATFTGLFAEDAEGRSIPDTAAFHCTWSRTARTRQIAAAVSDRIGGSTDSIYFKALGPDMALTFSTQTHQFCIDGEKEVVTFALRPSQYSADGPLPIIAKGTLDPNPYFDKPKKNYAIKLRDAAGQVTGKLLFSLVVHEVDHEVEAPGSADRLVRSPFKSPGTNSLDGGRLSLSRNPARDKLFKSSPTRQSSLASGTPPRVLAPPPPSSSSYARTASAKQQQQQQQHAAPVPSGAGAYTSSPVRSSPPAAAAAALAPSGASAFVNCVESVDVQLERVTVRSEGIDLEHPAPLLLGGDYNLKIRYGSFAYSTTRCVCCNPKEVEYRGQQTCITLQRPPRTEKLRFSLWEDKKQVAGFSLDPAKFSAPAGVWKEYAIPFRYHPTGQKAALDVRVRRLVVPLDGSPVGRHSRTPPSHRQPTMTTGATEPIAFPAESASVPRRLVYNAETQTRLTATASADHQQQHQQQQQQEQRTPLRSPKRQDNATTKSPSSPRSIVVTGGLLANTTHRDATPHRHYHDADGDRSAHTGSRSGNPGGSAVRSGWQRTPILQRPPPLTQNLADLPADRRPPDDHETYIAEVLARLNRQPRGGPRQPTSLMEEWMGWRDDRERSRCNSVANSAVRSNSVSSVVSRADSLASVGSRHASVPRATKSIAEQSLMTPFTPDYSAFRRRRASPSPAARNPLV